MEKQASNIQDKERVSWCPLIDIVSIYKYLAYIQTTKCWLQNKIRSDYRTSKSWRKVQQASPCSVISLAFTFSSISSLIEPSEINQQQKSFTDYGAGLKRLELSSCLEKKRQKSASNAAADASLIACSYYLLFQPPFSLLAFLRRLTARVTPEVPSASATNPPEKIDEGGAYCFCCQEKDVPEWIKK